MRQEDTLRQIWRHLCVRDAARLGACSVALREVDRSLREGQHVLWLDPSISAALSDQRRLYDVDKDSSTVTKNWRPGTGHVAGAEPSPRGYHGDRLLVGDDLATNYPCRDYDESFGRGNNYPWREGLELGLPQNEPTLDTAFTDTCGFTDPRMKVDAYSTFFQVKLESYNGHRCEIGVCARSAITSQGLDKSRAWYCDCWGRKVHNHVQQEYGGKMSTGDVVGVLYNKLNKTLSFFENGRNMGVAFENVTALAGPLVPFVSIPFWEGEQVRFLRHPEDIQLPLSVAEMSIDDEYEPRMHPDDNKILVKTFLNRIFLVSADPQTTTVMQLKETLAPMCGYPAAHLALRISGKQLLDPLALLSDMGLVFEANGSHTEEVLMYVPHEVS